MKGCNCKGKVVMDRKDYLGEHKRLIKLLMKSGKEGKEQMMEIEKYKKSLRK